MKTKIITFALTLFALSAFAEAKIKCEYRDDRTLTMKELVFESAPDDENFLKATVVISGTTLGVMTNLSDSGSEGNMISLIINKKNKVQSIVAYKKLYYNDYSAKPLGIELSCAIE